MARMQVLTGREYEKGGERKTAWTIIGSAWPAKSGDGWDITLDALPVSGKMILRPPREDKPAADRATGGGEIDDQIPFNAEMR